MENKELKDMAKKDAKEDMEASRKEVQAYEKIYKENGCKETDTILDCVSVPYADGLTRALSNKFKVIVNGKEAPIIGRICMDTCMIDITDIDVKLGDEAVIFDLIFIRNGK